MLHDGSKTNGYYNAFNVYRRELAPGTVSLTGDRAQGDDSKHWAYSTRNTYPSKHIKKKTPKTMGKQA